MRKVFKDINQNKYVFWFIICVVFIVIWYLTAKTQLYADDYNYKFIWGTDIRVNSVKDVFISQYKHYFEWGGRTVAHLLVQMFLFLDKGIFNIINSVIFILLVLLIYINSSSKKVKNNYNVLNLMLIILILWQCIPVFGECILWVTGSINYMWTMVILLAFITPYIILSNSNSDIIGNKKVNYLIMAFFGVIAGWTNENMSISIIFLIISIFIYRKIKSYMIPKWYYFGILGMVIGFIMMIIAPGNFRRAETLDLGFLHKLLNFITSVEVNITSYGQLFFVSTILLSGYIIINKVSDRLNDNNEKKYATNLFIMFSALISICSMIASPYFPERSMFGTSILIIVLVMSIIFEDNNAMFNQYYKLLIVALLGILFSVSFIRTIIKLNRLETEIEQRYSVILESKENGIEKIELDPIRVTRDKHVFLVEIEEDPYDWKNRSMSKYFNIDYLKLRK